MTVKVRIHLPKTEHAAVVVKSSHITEGIVLLPGDEAEVHLWNGNPLSITEYGDSSGQGKLDI